MITGLDYANNRHYDSQQGRFTQADPAGMGMASLVNPQSLNLYAYCTNDPINHVDPNGLGFLSFLKKVFKWVAVAVSIALIVVGVVALLYVPALTALFASTGIAAGVTATLAVEAAAISAIVAGGLGLLSEFGPRSVRTIAGLASLAWSFFSPFGSFQGSSGTGNGFGNGFQGTCPPDCSGQITLTFEVPPIFAHYSALEMKLWNGLHHLTDFVIGAFDYGAGPPPIFGFTPQKFIRHRIDSFVGAHLVNEESWSYYAGSWVPDVVAGAAGGGVAFDEAVEDGFVRIGQGYIRKGATSTRFRISVGGTKEFLHGHLHAENWYKPWRWVQKFGKWKRYD